MLKQLRIKFVCVNMLIAAAMLCVILGMVFYFTRQGLEADSLRTMQALAEEPPRPGPPGQRRMEMRLPYLILEVGPKGEVTAAGSGYYDLSDEAFLRELLTAVWNAPEPAGIIPAYHLRFQRVATPVSQRIVFVDTSGEQSTLRNLVQTCAAIGLAGLLAFFLISLALAHWAVRPIERAWSRQRQFVADASHELKTPLTVILTNAELLQRPDCSETARAQLSAGILTMANQMRGLAESLLELARVDSGSIQAAMAPVDLSSLLSDALLPFEPLYFEQGLEIRPAIEPDLRVNGSERRLRQVAEILLDNAMKYSAAPAAVAVTLKRRGLHALLTVSNPGISISPEDLRNIFKRFYRLDKARSINRGYGLGLSIAEGIVKEHRGRIWAASRAGINTFYVELPLL